jgi:hypothetical protein
LTSVIHSNIESSLIMIYFTGTGGGDALVTIVDGDLAAGRRLDDGSHV